MTEPWVGEIRMFGGDFAPAGWVLCDGRELPITGEYEQLYQVIGTTYGGGTATFAVPDLRAAAGDVAPPAVVFIIALRGRVAARSSAGPAP